MTTITSTGKTQSIMTENDGEVDSPIPSQSREQALELLSLTVQADRVVARLRVGQSRFRRMTPLRAKYLAEKFPTLAIHACVNGRGDTFGAVMEHTSVPHMFEHLVIELQTRASGGSDAVFVGTSEWEDEAAGIARVQVSFTDDLQALRAFKDATRILNIAVLL